MILPDLNVLVHAYNTQFPQHEKARAWWQAHLGGIEGVALAWAVAIGFVRIMTNRRILEYPLTPGEALLIVEEWLDLPHVMVVQPGPAHFHHLKRLLLAVGTAGNLTTDAHLAAIAVERGLVLHTTDADFARFPGLKWKNPLR